MKPNIASTQGQRAASSKTKPAQVDIDVGQLCVKVRREKVTHFFLCKPLETIQSLKRKVSMFVKGSDPADIRLYLGTRLLDDKSNIHDQDVRNNTLLYYKLKKGNTGEWQEFPDLGI